MAFPYQSSGFQVGVMPQVNQIDPRLFASDPSQIGRGILNAFQVMGANQELKDAKAIAEERAATKDSRLAQIKALSDLQVLAADAAAKTQKPRIEADLASLGLSTAKDTGALADLPVVRAVDNLDRILKAKRTNFDIQNMEKNEQIAEELRQSEILKNKAMAANYWAEAERYKAMAKAAGAPEMGKDFEEWHKSIGDLAARVGKNPQQVKELYASGIKNSTTGVTLAAELAAMNELLKKPEWYFDPAEKASPELLQWLGDSGVQAIRSLNATEGKVKGSAQAPEEAGQAPAKIKIDANGNISGGGMANATPAPVSATPAEADGSSGGNAAATGALLALSALGTAGAAKKGEALTSGAKKLATRLWNGRSATGQFTGNALKSLPARSLRSFAARGVSAAAAPVAALYTANESIGNLLSDKDTGDLTALQGIALAATQPSFEEQAREAKYDELSHRITSIAQSANLSDEVKQQQLIDLINQRDVLWSMMSKD